MKVTQRIGSIIILIALLASSFVPRARAQENLSLTDAILADLALHNFLDYISIDFQDKKSPNTIAINETRQWLPASTVKLFVAMYAADQIEKGTISLDQQVIIDPKNVVSTELETAQYPALNTGMSVSIDTLLHMMIDQSDNTAYNTLLDVLDRQNVTDYVQSLGLTHTIIGSKLNLDDAQTQYEYTTPGYNINTTTAADYAKAYDLIDSKKIPGSSLLFDILKQQKIQNMIPAFLPMQGLTIAHKTGDLDPLYHDGGIIIGDNRHYILTIFTNLRNPYVIAHISQLIFTKNYKLIGATIPDKNTPLQAPQALDPLVLNSVSQAVLAAETPSINIPIPQITAADLGITPSELSLVIPDSKLPKSYISPSSPFHILVPFWYGVQTAFALGEKNRQHVALTYTEQLIADAKQLQKQNNTTQVIDYMDNVQRILNAIATDKMLKPDAETQLEIQSVSQTQFAVFKNQLNQTANNTTRLMLLQQVANNAKQTLHVIAPNIPQAKTLAAASQQPLIGHVVNDTPGHIVIETASGQQITVATTNETRILSQNTQVAIPAPAAKPITQQPTPPFLIPASQKLQKGEAIALLGSIQGSTFTPSVMVTNLPRELAAPQPVSVLRVNTKNNTMVVNENGTPIQIDLSAQTTIKAKDTNVPLGAIQPGAVVVVRGTAIQQVHSNNITPTPTSKQPTGKPTEKPTSQPAVGKLTPQPTIKPTSKQEQPAENQPTPTSQQPTVIRATSVQVIQQKATPLPTTKSQQQPTQPKPQPQQPAQSAPKPVGNKEKKTGK